MPAAGAIQIGRGAAGEQNQDEIVCAGAVGERQSAFGAGEPGLVGHRMAGLDHGDALRRPAVAVARHGDAGEPVFAACARDNAVRPLRSSSRAALPAASTISRPRGGGSGRCGGRQCDGWAAATAVRNSDSSNSRDCVARGSYDNAHNLRRDYGKTGLWKDGAAVSIFPNN